MKSFVHPSIQNHPLAWLRAAAVVSILLAAAGCSREATPVDFQAAASFDVTAADGTVHVLFSLPEETDEATPAFYHVRAENGGGWSSPVRVATDHAVPGRHHRGNDPQLAVSGDRLLALWTAQGDGPWGSGPFGAALSGDGGRTWQAAPVPVSPDGGPGTGYRFPAVAADGEAFHAIWIHAKDDIRSLRHARLPFGADAWETPVEIDPNICACCWLRLDATGDGQLTALYRDYEPSDMALAVSADSGRTWSRQGRVGEFDWHFQGCPHVGGGLATGHTSGGEPLTLASVWTGGDNGTGVHLYRKTGDTGGWQPSTEENGVLTRARNTDIALAPGGGAVWVWDQLTDDGVQAVFLAVSGDAGRTWGPPRRLTAPASNGGHPRVVLTDGQAWVFWTAPESDGGARLLWQTFDPADATGLAGRTVSNLGAVSTPPAACAHPACRCG